MGSKNWTVKELCELSSASVNQQIALHRLHDARIGRFSNTMLSWDSFTGEVVVCLHFTNVVRINSDGEIRLYSGGWRTATAKKRINECLEALNPMIEGRPVSSIRVWQVRGYWRLYTRHYATNGEGCAVFAEDFREGIYAGSVA